MKEGWYTINGALIHTDELRPVEGVCESCRNITKDNIEVICGYVTKVCVACGMAK